jgi:hypothetical protein
MMLGAFGRMLTNQSIRPLITKGQWPAIVASITAGIAAAIWLKMADKLGKPGMKEYFLIVALIVGMVCGQITRLSLTP